MKACCTPWFCQSSATKEPLNSYYVGQKFGDLKESGKAFFIKFLYSNFLSDP